MEHFLLLEDSSTSSCLKTVQRLQLLPHDLPSPPFLAIRLILLVKYYHVPTGEMLALLKEKEAELRELASVLAWAWILGVMAWECRLRS